MIKRNLKYLFLIIVLFLFIFIPSTKVKAIKDESIISTCIGGCDKIGETYEFDAVYCENFTDEGYYALNNSLFNFFSYATYRVSIWPTVFNIHYNYYRAKNISESDSVDSLKRKYNYLKLAEAGMLQLETDPNFPCIFYDSTTEDGYNSSLHIAKDQIRELKEEIEKLYLSKKTFGCDLLLGANYVETSKTYAIIEEVFKIVRIVIPILLVILGTFDLVRAVAASSAEDMKKAQQKFIKRIVAGVVIFLLPTIVMAVINLMSNSADICVLGDL